MSYDVNKVQMDMLGAIKAVVGTEWPKIEKIARGFLDREKGALSENFFLDPDEKNFKLKHKIHMNRLRFHMKLEFLMQNTIPKNLAEKASNRAINVLDDAMKQDMIHHIMPFTIY